MSGYRRARGGRIDRSTRLGFTFDGRAYSGQSGDTLASALIASGVMPMVLFLPILPQLQSILDASPLGKATFLETGQGKGKPFTAAGFGNWVRDRCNEAGLPHCSAHGLRKAGATIAAENGATDQQMMALFGWSSPQLVAHYARAASQKLAASAMHLLIPRSSPS